MPIPPCYQYKRLLFITMYTLTVAKHAYYIATKWEKHTNTVTCKPICFAGPSNKSIFHQPSNVSTEA